MPPKNDFLFVELIIFSLLATRLLVALELELESEVESEFSSLESLSLSTAGDIDEIPLSSTLENIEGKLTAHGANLEYFCWASLLSHEVPVPAFSSPAYVDFDPLCIWYTLFSSGVDKRVATSSDLKKPEATNESLSLADTLDTSKSSGTISTLQIDISPIIGMVSKSFRKQYRIMSSGSAISLKGKVFTSRSAATTEAENKAFPNSSPMSRKNSLVPSSNFWHVSMSFSMEASRLCDLSFSFLERRYTE
mmetsp:Transcript_16234/g.27193  ORF Transcript_16234/g.27193 Transcript_16234/m.27193 type:complete len:250 (+) Transcript_16234:1763-2512(+)